MSQIIGSPPTRILHFNKTEELTVVIVFALLRIALAAGFMVG